jgi:excisionase family DNA binding protein
MVDQEFCSVRQAAQKTGTSPDTVRLWIRKGLLSAFKFGGDKADYYIKISDLAEFIEQSRVLDLSGKDR